MRRSVHHVACTIQHALQPGQRQLETTCRPPSMPMNRFDTAVVMACNQREETKHTQKVTANEVNPGGGVRKSEEYPNSIQMAKRSNRTN